MESLTQQQLIDLAAAGTRFMCEMRDQHDAMHISITIQPSGMSINIGSMMAVNFHVGPYAHRSLVESAGLLEDLCVGEGWTPRFIVPDWAK